MHSLQGTLKAWFRSLARDAPKKQQAQRTKPCLENLPNELLQHIWFLSLSLDLPYVSKNVHAKLISWRTNQIFHDKVLRILPFERVKMREDATQDDATPSLEEPDEIEYLVNSINFLLRSRLCNDIFYRKLCRRANATLPRDPEAGLRLVGIKKLPEGVRLPGHLCQALMAPDEAILSRASISFLTHLLRAGAQLSDEWLRHITIHSFKHGMCQVLCHLSRFPTTWVTHVTTTMLKAALERHSSAMCARDKTADDCLIVEFFRDVARLLSHPSFRGKAFLDSSFAALSESENATMWAQVEVSMDPSSRSSRFPSLKDFIAGRRGPDHGRPPIIGPFQGAEAVGKILRDHARRFDSTT